ncbi:APM4 [Candida pseudojiufengensis]|uniref:APM4 n=1 Tax=Candida pseudojiufengensis TaxID=497109 RepID=UPI0022259DF8|nr:APM4 [Candida pseudojiufengensis]KAI5966427.1 APM4 [Candida pseudojiufengensis]
MISALFIYDNKGDVLISKLYKEDVKRNVADVFRIQVINQASIGKSNRDQRTPVLTLGSTSFIYIKSGNVWICAVTRSNQDCSLILEFLYKLEALLCIVLWDDNNKKKHQQEKLTLSDNAIVNGFPLIYDILGEVCDYGYPINLDIEYLKKYVVGLNESTVTNIFKKANFNPLSQLKKSTPPVTDTEHHNVTWRAPNIKYRRNEIYLNVEEKLNILMSAQGEILRSTIDGAIKMKSHLSGMPQCKFGFNQNTIFLTNYDIQDDERSSVVALEDSKFHQCVELDAFENDRTIQFIPPDGEFQLMSYNCSNNTNIPFKIIPQVQEIKKNKLIYKIALKTYQPPKLAATDFKIKIPTPRNVISTNFLASNGKVKYHPEEHAMIWKFNKIYGEQDNILTAEVEIQSQPNNDFSNWNRPPITIDFNLDMWSSSGLTVKYLKVQDKSKYKTVKWVRYTTKSGSYEVRY